VIWADLDRGTREDLNCILPHSNAQALQEQGCLTHVETLAILSIDCPVTQIHTENVCLLCSQGCIYLIKNEFKTVIL